MIFPITSMPLPLRVLSHVVPARWFVEISRGVMVKGAGLVDLWREIAILAAMSVLLLGVGIRRLAIRLP